MRRLLLVLALLGAAAVVVVGVVLMLDSRQDATEAQTPQASVSVVSAGVEPTSHAFGDPVTAEVVVVADASIVRPESIRIATEFEPYEVDGPVLLERRESGSRLRLRFRYPLVCIREGCEADGPSRC